MLFLYNLLLLSSIEIYTNINLYIIDQNIYLIYSGFTVLCMYKSMRVLKMSIYICIKYIVMTL